MARADLRAADGRAPGHGRETRQVTFRYVQPWRLVHRRRRPSAQQGPGAGRAHGRAWPAAAAVRVTGGHQGGLAGCDVPLHDGEPWPGCAAAAPGSGPCTRCTATPGGRLVFHVFAALAELIRDSSWRGSRCPAPRPCSTARQWRCWPGLPRTGRPGRRGSRRPAPGVPCRRRPRSHVASDPRFYGWCGGRPRHSLICCWMTSGAGRASTV